MSQVILHNQSVAKEVSQFRKRFTEMKYCLPDAEATSLVEGFWKRFDRSVKQRLNVLNLPTAGRQG